jgi:ATP-dependent helicase/nuclease subunit A
MSLTDAQKEAIVARGNVLVVAGAGTGKTHTLVERCLSCLVDEKPRASLDQILMVTFTEAAAAEMRQRIRARLEQELERDPEESHWREQLALFETAHIGTLHSFCLKLVREHFYQLDLDPQLTVMAEEEARLLADETLDTLLRRHYAGRGAAATAVQQLIQAQGRGWDKPIRGLVLRLHHYTQTLPSPGQWLHDQLELFANPEPGVWRDWLISGVTEWCEERLPFLNGLVSGNDIAQDCANLLSKFPRQGLQDAIGPLLEEISGVANDCPRGRKALWIEPLEEFLKEARFLSSLFRAAEKADPLSEDWAWVRTQMTTLLKLAQEFTAEYSEAKHELGVVDFHDLEQHALQLLWDHKSNQPSPIALHWRKRLRFIFVDEYQDINAAQDRIIQAVSREGEQANRFLVGDAKQSIYRFRLANPQIFQGYVRSWNGQSGKSIALVDNFRSRETILEFINSLFAGLMRAEAGGISYDKKAELRFGDRSERRLLGVEASPAPSVELHLRARQRNNGGDWETDEESNDALAEIQDLEESEKEARVVAMRVRELHSQRHRIWDEKLKDFRVAEWQDIAILLRSPAGKAESYAKEFARMDIPLQVARGGFYKSSEISDLVSLLQMLDNPLQDIPVLAVLRSPLVGLSLNELAMIRLTAMKVHFYAALLRWKETHARPAQRKTKGAEQLELLGEGRASHGRSPGIDTEGAWDKVTIFLERFARWRRLARQVSLSRCLEAVLSETHYADWLLTQPDGEQRRAKVQRLISLAEQFDQFQRQGLFRFLQVIEAQQRAEVEPQVSAVRQQNAVLLMSIHQSKGLEFPIAVVPDLGKAFNLTDLRAEIILDEQYGLCPQVKPPQTGKRYPSLPYWLARRRQLRELLGEEMRLLYVAMTRARDTLVLSASVSAKSLKKLRIPGQNPELADVVAARSYADWIGLWFSQFCAQGDVETRQGESSRLRWFIHDDAELALPGVLKEPMDSDRSAPDSEVWTALEKRLSWSYAFNAATTQPAKTSVSEMRRQANELDELPDAPFQATRTQTPAGRRAHGKTKPSSVGRDERNSKASAADVGSAHHRFLQLFPLDNTGNYESLQQEARKLQYASALTQRELELLDFKALANFWGSELGQRIRAQKEFVHRELAFTARFLPSELGTVTGQSTNAELDGEFVVVQGVADLVVLLPQEIWLIDFKTDTVGNDELPEKIQFYRPQMTLYAQALSRIFRRPVRECWLCFLGCDKQVLVEVRESGQNCKLQIANFQFPIC